MITLDENTYTSEHLARINDTIRMNLCKLRCNVRVEGICGQLVFTRNAIDILGDNIEVLLSAVATFNQFNEANNPYGENDFGKIELFGQKWFWKFDYYDKKLQYFGHHTHVLTVMLAEDY
ncbi:MAG: DUF3768 domain-containing protein [Bacteroidota bacterium]|jgi:hypothetical protein